MLYPLSYRGCKKRFTQQGKGAMIPATMTLSALLGVFIGAGLGACLRYALGLALNPVQICWAHILPGP